MAMHVSALPAQEMAALRNELAPQYGARTVDEGDRRILFIRVPRDQPDPVNDVESAIDFLDPSDVQDITHCMLVGNTQVAQVYAAPLRDLMQRRLVFDESQFKEWRERLPGVLAHQLYRSPGDPRRRWRLAIRLPCANMALLTEEILEELADAMGSQLESQRFNELAAVYLIAAEDHVRMEPDVFIQELRKTWRDEIRRNRLIQEKAAALDEARRREAAERRTVLGELSTRFKPAPSPSVSHPLRAERAHGRETALEATGQDLRTQPGIQTTRPLAQATADVTTRRDPEATALRARVDRITRNTAPAGLPVPTSTNLAARLRQSGFEVLENPQTAFQLDLAAERPEGHPQRLVARFMDRVRSQDAAELLLIGRDLDVDAVFVVTDEVEPEAERQLVASKVTCLTPRDVDTLTL